MPTKQTSSFLSARLAAIVNISSAVKSRDCLSYRCPQMLDATGEIVRALLDNVRLHPCLEFSRSAAMSSHSDRPHCRAHNSHARGGRVRAAGHDRTAAIVQLLAAPSDWDAKSSRTVDRFLHPSPGASGRQHRFLLDADDASTSTAFPIRRLRAWMKVTSGRMAGTAANTSPVNGPGDRFDVRVDRRQPGAAIAAEHRTQGSQPPRPHRHWPCRRGCVPRSRSTWKTVLDGVADAAAGHDAGIAGIGGR